jgi:hypothetical protein
MGLNIESLETPHAECLNHPNDVYIYFKGGFYVWNWKNDKALHVWFNDDLFTFNREEYHFPNAAVAAFNEWSGKHAQKLYQTEV